MGNLVIFYLTPLTVQFVDYMQTRCTMCQSIFCPKPVPLSLQVWGLKMLVGPQTVQTFYALYAKIMQISSSQA